QIEVEAHRREITPPHAAVIEGELLQIRIGQLLNATGVRCRTANVGQQFPDHRINSRRLTTERQQIDRPARILEEAGLRVRTQDIPRPGNRVGLAEFLEVDEEESPVLPIEEFRNPDGAAYAATELIEQIGGARRIAFVRVKWLACRAAITKLGRLNVVGRYVTIREPVVGIQNRVAMILIKAAVVFVGSRSGGEFDLNRAL